jgi:ankyrin repeat protein
MLLAHHPPANANALETVVHTPYSGPGSPPDPFAPPEAREPAATVRQDDDSHIILAHDPFNESNYGSSPVEAAISRNDVALLELLFKHGVKWEDPRSRPQEMLVQAISGQHAEALDFLLAHHVPLSVAPGSSTPLHTAAQMGDEHAVHALLAAGAENGLPDSNNTTPADVARTYGFDELANLLDQVPPHVQPAKASEAPSQKP